MLLLTMTVGVIYTGCGDGSEDVGLFVHAEG